MNQKFNVISIILMAILVVLLCFVMNNYYNKREEVSSGTPIDMSMTDKLLSSGDNDTIVSNFNNNTGSGDEKIISSSGEIIKQSGEVSGEKVSDSNSSTLPEQPQASENQVVMTSNGNISDREKKEVLKELDQTLMELLDVVDKVQIVDETRLEATESEVQP